MNKKSRNIAVAIGLALSLGGGFLPSPALADPVETGVEAKAEAGRAFADWTKGANSDITAVGVGLPGNRETGVGVAMARRAAIMDAQRLLAEMTKGVSVSSEATMLDLVVTSDVVKTKVEGVLNGAQIVDEGPNPDGSYFVKMRVPLYGATGSLASAAIPEVRPETEKPVPPPVVTEPTISKQEIKAVQRADYTGVVVDASSLGLAPTFSPIIYDTNGRAVYGIDNIASSVAINQGMVGYANALENATSGSRAGANPLVVTAVEVRGGRNSSNPVNVVVSVEDADRILKANETRNFLASGAVMFVK